MGRVVGQVHEERAVAIGLDRHDRLVGEVVGHVAVGLEHGAAVEPHAARLRRPEKSVDRIECILRVDDVRTLRVVIHRAPRQESQAFVEAVPFRMEFRGFAQVPFAQVQRVVARFREQFRDRDLARRQALRCERGHVLLSLAVVDGVVEGIAHVHRHHAGEIDRGAGELKSKPGRIAACHQRRP